MKLYGEISKTEAQDDGTIKVWGFASSTAVDSDGDTITAEAMKAALPDYMKFGAVREMHQAKAAGTAIEAEVQEDGRTYFGAHIVDSEAVKKVNAGVYKGFSIGGKVTGRDELKKTTITGLKLVEISLVDRPANQEAVYTLVKFEDIDKVETVDLKKYLGDSSYDARFASSILSDVYSLLYSEIGDSDEVGGKEQIDVLKQIITNLKTFIASEIQEPDPDLDAVGSPGADAVALAATTDELNKAGAEISAKNKEKAQAIHDHSVSLGAKCSPDAGKADRSDDLHKLEDLQKFEDLQKQIHGVCVENDTLKKSITGLTEELEKIKSEPEPPKVALNDKGVVVSKAEDSGTLHQADNEVFVKDVKGNINEAATLIKLSHRSGGLARH